MNHSYDSEVDVLCFQFSNEPIDESDEVEPGVIVDYDKNGNVVSIELLDSSTLNFSQLMHKLTAATVSAGCN
jgi:uncharacterized protein YuzE